MSLALTDEGVDPCLTGSVLERTGSVGERSRRLPVFNNPLDVGDRWHGIMGDREETGVCSTVDGGEGSPFVRGGTAWETTGGRSGGSRVADDGETGVDRCRRENRAQRLINLEIPVLVRSLKSSNVELG